MGPHEHRLRKSIVAHRPERENEVQRRGGGNELGQDMGMASMLTGDMTVSEERQWEGPKGITEK